MAAMNADTRFPCLPPTGNLACSAIGQVIPGGSLHPVLVAPLSARSAPTSTSVYSVETPQPLVAPPVETPQPLVAPLSARAAEPSSSVWVSQVPSRPVAAQPLALPISSRVPAGGGYPTTATALQSPGRVYRLPAAPAAASENNVAAGASSHNSVALREPTTAAAPLPTQKQRSSLQLLTQQALADFGRQSAKDLRRGSAPARMIFAAPAPSFAVAAASPRVLVGVEQAGFLRRRATVVVPSSTLPAPARGILLSGGSSARHSERRNSHVVFGFRYSVDSQDGEVAVGKRISEVEDEKQRRLKSQKLKQWLEEKRLCMGEDAGAELWDPNVNSDGSEEEEGSGTRGRLRTGGFDDGHGSSSSSASGSSEDDIRPIRTRARSRCIEDTDFPDPGDEETEIRGRTASEDFSQELDEKWAEPRRPRARSEAILDVVEEDS